MSGKITFLGTGTSSGIPVIGCNCEVCTSSDPRDTRFRTSAWIETSSGEKILIDVGPDYRQQALLYNIHHIDGILITHSHHDHIGGLDELRQNNFFMRSAIQLYGNKPALEEIRERFGYIFRETQRGGGKPQLFLKELLPGETFHIGKQEITPIEVLHGEIPILGYRIDDLLYITDAKSIPEKSMELIHTFKPRKLVINALRYRPHSTHLNIEESLYLIDKIVPEFAYLVHFTHDIKHSELESKLPSGVYAAYDGLTFDF